MIVLMMGLDNKFKFILGKSKLILLLLFTYNLIGCQNKEIKVDNLSKVSSVNDSILIQIKLANKSTLDLYYFDDYFEKVILKFTNEYNDTITKTKKIKRFHKNTILYYGIYIAENRTLRKIEQQFPINEEENKIELIFDSKNHQFKNKDLGNLLLKQYQNLYNKNKTKTDISEIDSVFNKNRSLFIEEDSLLYKKINELYYHYYLEKINPKNQAVDSYLKNLKYDIGSIYYRRLLFNYVKNRIHKFDYNKIKTTSDEYKNHIAIGHYFFLKWEDNKGDVNYKHNLEWLKQTKFYKKDSLFIRKIITPISNYKFRLYFKNLVFENLTQQKKKTEEIINENPTDYYLIDFWATWCAPCIEGVKLMNKMNLPKNIKVLSISLDKEKDKNKWKEKTKELQQKYSFWLDEESPEAKAFLQFIELLSIPRYILIDKNLNLIDQAFYHPNEPQFLNLLKDIKNHKYW